MDQSQKPKNLIGLNKILQKENLDYYEGCNEYLITQAHHYIANESYWSPGISLELFGKALEHSWNFSAFESEKLVAFARLVTDYATFAYLGDVFVMAEYRGKGIGKNLMQLIFSREEVRYMRRIILATSDAHQLYEKYGFAPLKNPSIMMEIFRPAEELYKA